MLRPARAAAGERTHHPTAGRRLRVADCGTCQRCGTLTYRNRPYGSDGCVHCQPIDPDAALPAVRQVLRKAPRPRTQRPSANPFEMALRPRRYPPELRAYQLRAQPRANGRDQRQSTRRRREHIVQIVFDIAAGHLDTGHSSQLAVEHLALGADQIARRLADRYGTVASANTIRSDLKAVFGAPTGQLQEWTDINAKGQERAWKWGAYTYRLDRMRETLGRFGRKLYARLNQRILTAARPRTQSATALSSIRGTGGGRSRIHGALNWAIDHARPGSRNTIGYWLARRCCDAALTEGKATKVMSTYQKAVRSLARPEYAWAEAKSTLQSAYRLHGSI